MQFLWSCHARDNLERKEEGDATQFPAVLALCCISRHLRAEVSFPINYLSKFLTHKTVRKNNKTVVVLILKKRSSSRFPQCHSNSTVNSQHEYRTTASTSYTPLSSILQFFIPRPHTYTMYSICLWIFYSFPCSKHLLSTHHCSLDLRSSRFLSSHKKCNLYLDPRWVKSTIQETGHW